MQQLAPSYILSCVPKPYTIAGAKAIVLSTAQAGNLGNALLEDARGAIYSGIVCVADALSGLSKGYFSWAIVKLYYACFYFAKAAIARRRHCVVYVGRSPLKVMANAGEQLHPQSGNSHSVVTSIYKLVVSSGILNLQPVDGVHAFDWMTNVREEVNYRQLRFTDPDVPECCARIDTVGARGLVGAYLSDPNLYAFDSDHAILALPLAAMADELSSNIGFAGLGLTSSHAAILRGMFRDKQGPLAQFSLIEG